MSWKPPLTLEEKLKQRFIPPSLYIRYLYAKQLMSGEPEFKLIPFLANKARVSLDIGAHKGAYSFALLKHSQSVHSFEPNPKMFDVLESWARGRVTLHASALSNLSGEADLLVPRRGNGYSNQGGSLSAIKVHGDHGTVRVKASRLDDFGIDNVGFIKIDVEGFENEVLEGARELLLRDRPNLLVEMEEKHTKIPLKDMVASVCAYGYRCIVLQGGSMLSFERFDVKKFHTSPASRKNYVFNFIFLPV
jgi:FkbM family methyltransferase